MDKLFMRRWGYTLVGIIPKFKFLVNRFLRFLFKPWSNIYYRWDWFKRPFSLCNCVFRTSDGFMFKVYDGDSMPGSHELRLHKALQKYVGRGSIFFDIGAHVGGFTIRASRIVGNEGLVIAFEPNFRNYYYLMQNIYINRCRNVIALPLAVHSATGTILSFNISTRSGHSSITELHKDEILFKTYVYTITIDDVVKVLSLTRVNAIKIDVEGAEIEVLKGAKNTLDKYRPTLLIEVHGEKQWKLLKEMLQGYIVNIVHELPHHQWPKHILALPRR